MNAQQQYDPLEEVATHFIGRMEAADLIAEPYPHIYVTRCFPEWYYAQMLEALPEDEVYTDRTFDHRAMCHAFEAGPFWKDLQRWMLSPPVIKAVLDTFPNLDLDGKLRADVRLVRDTLGYQIKPHTDIKAKLISLLFYLTKESQTAGTTVMIPKEAGFTSDGTRRYEFGAFTNVFTAPFEPNTMFGFPRSDKSFHGVEATTIGRRDVLLLNLYRFK